MMNKLTYENVQAVCDKLSTMLDGWVFTYVDEVDGRKSHLTELRVDRLPSVTTHTDKPTKQLLFSGIPIIDGREVGAFNGGITVHMSYDNQDDAPHYRFCELPEGRKEFVVTQMVGRRRVVYRLQQQFRLTRKELLKRVRIH